MTSSCIIVQRKDAVTWTLMSGKHLQLGERLLLVLTLNVYLVSYTTQVCSLTSRPPYQTNVTFDTLRFLLYIFLSPFSFCPQLLLRAQVRHSGGLVSTTKLLSHCFTHHLIILSNYSTPALIWSVASIFLVYISCAYPTAGGTRLLSWLRHCATSREVAGSIPDSVIGTFR